MPAPGCEACPMRTRYDANPRSLLGRMWRWHAGWCPGFRQYLSTLPAHERTTLIARFGLERTRNGRGAA